MKNFEVEIEVLFLYAIEAETEEQTKMVDEPLEPCAPCGSHHRDAPMLKN